MSIFKKKPIEQPKPLTPQDFEESQDVPVEEQYEEPAQPSIPQRVERVAQGFSNAIYSPPQPIPQPIPQQEVPRVIKKAVVQAPVQPQVQEQEDVYRDAILELETRIARIESWIFRTSR